MGKITATITHTNPKGIRKVYDRMNVASSRVVAVGFPVGMAQAYPDGTPVAEIAAMNVYGAPPKIPARDFMSQARPDIAKHQHEVAEKNFMRPGFENTLLNALGEMAVADIKRSIKRGDYEPLAEYTLEKRREKGITSDKPLVETGHMLLSVTHVVRNKD